MIRFITLSVILFVTISNVSAQDPLSSQFRNLPDARLQRSPHTLRGGISFSPSEPTGSLTIYRGRMELDSICGFDFDFNFREQLARVFGDFRGPIGTAPRGGGVCHSLTVFPGVHVMHSSTFRATSIKPFGFSKPIVDRSCNWGIWPGLPTARKPKPTVSAGCWAKRKISRLPSTPVALDSATFGDPMALRPPASIS